MVLLAPVTTPFVIYKMKKMEGKLLMLGFLVLFAGVITGESLMYSHVEKARKLNNLPPVTRQILEFCDQLKVTNQQVDQGLIQLENLSQVESTASQIQATLSFMTELRQRLASNQEAIQSLLTYLNDHEAYFEKKEVGWIRQLKAFYTHPRVTRHDKSLLKYLDEFELMLNFTYTYFDEISEYQDAAYKRNYDQFYLKYRRAVDRHILYNTDRIQFQDGIVSKMPALKPYLPGPRQTHTFRLLR